MSAAPVGRPKFENASSNLMIERGKAVNCPVIGDAYKNWPYLHAFMLVSTGFRSTRVKLSCLNLRDARNGLVSDVWDSQAEALMEDFLR